MASDNLRREVAQKLRELEVGDFPDGRFYDWGDVETALGIVDYGSWYKEADVQRLADLIDRPTISGPVSGMTDNNVAAVYRGGRDANSPTRRAQNRRTM